MIYLLIHKLYNCLLHIYNIFLMEIIFQNSSPHTYHFDNSKYKNHNLPDIQFYIQRMCNNNFLHLFLEHYCIWLDLYIQSIFYMSFDIYMYYLYLYHLSQHNRISHITKRRSFCFFY